MKELRQITKGAVLLDVSAIMVTVFTNRDDSRVGLSMECTELLERCSTSQVHAYVAPETATRIWKMFCKVADNDITKVLPQMPRVSVELRTAQRMKAFARSPFHLLSITSSTFERAVTLWEKTGAGIEACVALCAFHEVVPPPYIIVTTNNHYDKLASKKVIVLKPSDLGKKDWPLQGGTLLVSD